MPKGGIGRMKNIDLIKYIKQETGEDASKLLRPDLLDLAKKAQANEKS